jgi:hypothetical protein
VFWQSTTAKALWQRVIERWTLQVCSRRELDEWKRAILVPTPPLLGLEHRRKIMKATEAGGTDTTTVTRNAWALICYVSLHQLWRHRNSAAHAGTTESTIAITAKILATIYNQFERILAPQWSTQAGGTDAAKQRVRLRALIASLQSPHVLQPPPRMDLARLYYDGGSRGNPGIAGSGAVIVEWNGENWNVTWWDAHFVGKARTNNQAEYTALARGL